MLKSYFKTAFRFLLKNKTFSFINIAGLAIGTLCCLYILLYVQYQYSYDRHYKDDADIYRLTTRTLMSGDKYSFATASPPIGPALKNDFGEVRQFTRVVSTSNRGVKEHLLLYKDKSIYEKEALYVDSTFFDIFTYHFTYGTPMGALSDPYSVVLLSSTAGKLFGAEDPVGKTIEIDDAYGKNTLKVTGVVDESLGRSHIKANLFISMKSGGLGEYVLGKNDWVGNNFVATYIKLNPHTDPAPLERQLPAFLQKYGGQQLKSFGMEKQLQLQAVTDIHTSSGYDNELTKPVSASFLYILILIAVLIQVIACINFMNLSTARASKRAKEVGIRKVAGAERNDLVKQFLGESFFLSFVSVLLALPLLFLCIPYLNQITGADIRFSFITDWKIALLLIVLVISTGLLAGSYPAFYLSAFQVIKVLKGNFTSHISANSLRRSLVVFQFVLSIVLISCIIIIYNQLNYIKNKDLGFDRSQKLVFDFHTNDSRDKMRVFGDDLSRLSEVKSISKANNYPGQQVTNDWPFYLSGGSTATAQDAQFMRTDENFLRVMGIRLVSGRDFHTKDTGRVLINETLARKLGLAPEKAPGTLIYSQQDKPAPYVFEIAGVMKDFNYSSLHENVKSFLLMYDDHTDELPELLVSANTDNYKALLDKIEVIWKKDLPLIPLSYSFLDEEVQKQYETEIILSRIVNSFTFIAIFISCLGLFGLAAFSAEQRYKEIGVRKVLGASTAGIIRLLSVDFIKLVLIAIIIAVPIAWWLMNKWLEAFAYRINISWWMFTLAGVLALFIALFTVSLQALKAAMADPVKSLRSE